MLALQATVVSDMTGGFRLDLVMYIQYMIP